MVRPGFALVLAFTLAGRKTEPGAEGTDTDATSTVQGSPVCM